MSREYEHEKLRILKSIRWAIWLLVLAYWLHTANWLRYTLFFPGPGLEEEEILQDVLDERTYNRS